MGMLVVDESKCKKDGICVRECPNHIIFLKEGSGYPDIAPSSESVCIRCGHCVAVCPHEALSHAEISLHDCPAIEKDLTINEAQALQFLRSRRSIRLYKDKAVDPETIRRLIEAARYAPTAVNAQLVEWIVITDRAIIGQAAAMTADFFRQGLKENPQLTVVFPSLPMIVKAWDEGLDSILRNAPAVIVALAPVEAMNGMVDLTLALSYLDLIAPAMGLGTCWAGLLHRGILALPPLKEMLGIPDSHPHHYPMMLGYPAAQYYRLPSRKPPKITFR
jgi:nitroreductase/NAD-dependent dihydropyrimidine dehydrogenase PreA subunit